MDPFKIEFQINNALNAVRHLRSSVSNVFECTLAAENTSAKDEAKTAFLLELQESLGSIESNFKVTENSINVMNPPSGPFNLGNTSFLSHETDPEYQNAYSELINSYKWHEKNHTYTTMANQLLCQNSLKRSVFSSSNKRRFTPPSNLAAAPRLDMIIQNSNFPNMQMKIYRPFVTNAFLHINIGKVLKAAVILRGLTIEWVTVKGFNETLDNVDDHWVESRYQVFRKIQDHTHLAMMHFYSPTFPDLALKSFIQWFSTYLNLFNEPCKKCGKFLLNNLPPTFRDFRSLEIYHEECRH